MYNLQYFAHLLKGRQDTHWIKKHKFFYLISEEHFTFLVSGLYIETIVF